MKQKIWDLPAPGQRDGQRQEKTNVRLDKRSVVVHQSSGAQKPPGGPNSKALAPALGPAPAPSLGPRPNRPPRGNGPPAHHVGRTTDLEPAQPHRTFVAKAQLPMDIDPGPSRAHPTAQSTAQHAASCSHATDPGNRNNVAEPMEVGASSTTPLPL